MKCCFHAAPPGAALPELDPDCPPLTPRTAHPDCQLLLRLTDQITTTTVQP